MSTPNSTVSPREEEVADRTGGPDVAAPGGLRVVHDQATGSDPAAPSTSDSAGSPSSVGRGAAAPGTLVTAPNGETVLPDHTVATPDRTTAHGVDTPSPAVWLPVAEAAERTSVSESALRKWIKAGELLTRDAPGPRGLRTEVTVEAVVARARQAGIDASPRAGLDLADAFTRLENLTGQLIAMSDRAARAEVERDHLKRRLDELRAEKVSSVDGERRRADSERSRGDSLLGELSTARESLTAERARADAMLAAVPRRKRHLFERPGAGPGVDRTVSAPESPISAR